MKLWDVAVEMTVKDGVAEDKKTKAIPPILGTLSFQCEAETFEKAVEWINSECADCPIIRISEAEPVQEAA